MVHKPNRIHLSLEPNLVPQPLSIPSDIMNGHGGKPKGLWYAFDNRWLDYIHENGEQGDNPTFPVYGQAYRLNLKMDKILVIKNQKR